MKQFWKRHCPAVIGPLLLGLLFLAVISAIAVFGGVVMTWFGFTYRFIGSFDGKHTLPEKAMKLADEQKGV